jgi:eukaryotic-like serine/threonine-protein kinase
LRGGGTPLSSMTMENTEVGQSREPTVGDRIGPYRLIRALGQGTTGRVFEVEHAGIGRRAAMKIAFRDAFLPGLVDRLVAEAYAVNRINHPHVVQITDFLEPDGQHSTHALVMELLDGISLADLLAEKGRLETQRLLAIVAQICDGLAAVHGAGFAHRDLKPDNVFLAEHDGSQDFVKLLDFGLVKTVRNDGCHIARTVEGTFLGSPAYTSPEQAAGKAVDHRTDIYALGVILFELVTGRLPFEAQGIREMLTMQITAPPPHLPDEIVTSDVGQALDAIVQACLAKEPAERVLSAAQLAGMFRQLASCEAAVVTNKVAGPPARRRRRLPRGAWMIAPVVALASVLLLIATVGDPSSRSPRPATATAASAETAVVSPPGSTVIPARASPSPAPASQPRRAATPAAKRSTIAARPVSRAMTLDPYR